MGKKKRFPDTFPILEVFDVLNLGNLMLGKWRIPKHFPNSGNVSGFPVEAATMTAARLRRGHEQCTHSQGRTQHQAHWFQTPYRLPHAYHGLVRKDINDILAAVPLNLLVFKKDNTLRMCVWRTGGWTLLLCWMHIPCPRSRTSFMVWFIMTLDLSRGYWQVPMAKWARPLTAFSSYKFWVKLFGLKGAPVTLQRLMDTVLQGLQSFSVVYNRWPGQPQ